MADENMELDPYTEGPMPQPKQRRKSTPRGPMTEEAKESRAVKTKASQEKDLDEYCAQWDWDLPGMKCKLSRMSPRIHNNIQIAGHLETREGGGYTLEEIKDRFGGGTYKLNVSGFSEKQGTIRPMGNKVFEVGGAPNVDQVPAHVQAASSGTSGRGGGGDDLAANAQGALVGLVGKSLERAYDGNRGGDANPDLFSEMRQSVEASAREQVAAIREAAAQENSVLREQLNDMRQVATELRAELQTKDQQKDHEVVAARTESSGLLSTLLPTFSEQANQRSQQAQHDANERVARMQEQFARDMQGSEQRFAMQLENMKTMFQAQAMNQQTMFDSRMQQATAEIALLRQRCETLESDNRAMQQRNTELLLEQTKKHDPINLMQQAANVREVADGLFGGGGGGDGLSDDASDTMKLIHSFGQSLGSLAPVIAAKMGAGGMPSGGMPTGMPQQMAGPPPQAPPQAPPQRLAMPKQITPQAPQAKPKFKLRKQDLIAGVRLINSAISTGTEPARVADTAAQTLDRATLGELVRRKPIAVYTSLQKAGILEGPLETEEGARYMGAFLMALKERLGLGTPPPREPTQDPQPEPGPPVEEEAPTEE